MVNADRRDSYSLPWLRPLARLVAGLTMACALAATAHAQAPAAAPARAEPLQIVLTAHRITTDASGKETATEAKSVTAGDLVEYRATYTNRGAGRIEGLVATLPIPAGLEYQAHSAMPAGALAASGDGVFAAEPLLRKTTDAAGREKTEPVPYADYRALRWEVAVLEPGTSVSVAARAVVPRNAPTTPAPDVP